MAVRRHWPWMASIPIIVLTVILALVQHGADSQQAHAQASPAPLATTTAPAVSEETKVAYRRTQKIRTELAVESQDLAALGISSAVAQQIIGAVKAFAATDPDPMAGLETARRLAKGNLAEAVRKMNVGPRDDSVVASLPTLKQNMDAAQTQIDTAFAGLVVQINGMLTPEQQALWQAARTNAALRVPGAYRYAAGLTAAQAQQLDLAARHKGAPGLLEAAPQILSATQLAQAQAVNVNQQVSAAGVAVAEQQVLPVPPGLYAPPATLPANTATHY